MEEFAAIAAMKELGPLAVITLTALILGYKIVRLFYVSQQKQLESFLALQHRYSQILEKQAKSVDDIQRLINMQTDELVKRIQQSEDNVKHHISRTFKRKKSDDEGN
jgi:flagellar biosynthesis chaperone FliJ